MASKAHTALAALRAELAGEVFAPGDPGYDGARAVPNARTDRRPAVIARCAHVTDVVRAVRFARELDLRIAVRGGGLGLAGTLVDGALEVDLRRMHEVTVDPAAEAARVGGGATVGHLDRATLPYGLAATVGRAAAVGVAGCVLGGGTGPLDRAVGPVADHLIGVELVTADAERVHANADENPELFRALHGGGGNFGIATALTLTLHELPRLAAVAVLYRPEAGPAVVRAFREVVGAGPDEAGGTALYLSGRPAPSCAALVTYAGGEEELRTLAGPLTALPHEGEVYGARALGLPYPPGGLRAHWSAQCLTALPDAAVDTVCALAADSPAPGSRLMLLPLGGAVAAGAGGHRLPYQGAAWIVHPFACWADPADDERALAWVRDACAGVRPWSTDAVPLTLIGDEGPERVRAGLGEGNLLGLEKVKRRYDPDNVFRFNHNIRPL
ncbi:FAD-binding oxidoreductase [Streptomyces sp. Go40/10]|uniref:FAD-binding oxidoreductase n=1 Tax=Streptomyces sp. Go40/10 TaxID=2825844 RepID=UPI001E58448F|nr:FAD-binding oxidoreductase [Streptomyces sp. Go40/10]UFR05360.1 FAD-binding oxidoreductase [Streptomyces sp. Go40/10]